MIDYNLSVFHDVKQRFILQVKDHCQKMLSPCLCHILLLKIISFKLNVKTAYYLKICNDFELWSFLQIQGHYEQNDAPMSFQWEIT